MYKKPKLTNQKIVISGDTIELYEYEKPQAYDFDAPKNLESGSSVNSEDEENEKESKESIQKRSMQRTRKKLKRLILANAHQWSDGEGGSIKPKFVTLTFKENLKNVEEANNKLTNFFKRLNYEYFQEKKNKLKYTSVIEFQKRGAVHYHVVFYNLGWIDKALLSSVWKHGFVQINKIDSVDNIGAYVSKYLTKESAFDDRLVNKKKYSSSRGLFRPVEIRDSDVVDLLRSKISSLAVSYKNSFDGEYTGTVDYSIFDISEDEEVQKRVKVWLNSR